MVLNTKIVYLYFVILIYVLHNNFEYCYGKKTVFDMKRPKVFSFNESYISNASLITKKYNRSNPIHFLTLRFTTVRALNNTQVVRFYLYQLLSNVYKRSFVELHIRICDFFTTDPVIGTMIRHAYYRNPVSERPMKTFGCPLLPGYYKMDDMQVNLIDIPVSFPFPVGRVYCNVTDGDIYFLSMSMDFEIKTIN